MTSSLLVLTALSLGSAGSLGPGDHLRTLEVGGLKRDYLLHVPPGYDADRPAPLVMALHGLSMNAAVMAEFTGLSALADRAGFLVVYPDGTGPIAALRGWNAGAFPGDRDQGRPDDVAFLGKVLDDVELLLAVDPRRVYVTGMSNGAMMAYRLAAALSGRIAAIAPVAGTLPGDDCRPKRPVPVLHFHGTADTLVPFGGLKGDLTKVLKFKSVEGTLRAWAGLGSAAAPVVTELPARHDKLRVVRKDYTPPGGGAPAVLYVIEGGGHTWPGMHNHPAFLGASTDNIDANQTMWEFFQRHPLR